MPDSPYLYAPFARSGSKFHQTFCFCIIFLIIFFRFIFIFGTFSIAWFVAIPSTSFAPLLILFIVHT